MADFDAQQPVRTTATEFTTEVANAAGTTINPAEEFAQASTTSGQSGPLVQGAATTAAPTYTTGTTNPLSLDTSGNLRVTSTPSGLQNVNIADIGGNAVTTTLPVSGTVAVTQSTSPWVVSGTVTTSPNVNVHDGTGVSISSTGSSLNVDVTNTVPVTGTFFQATQPVSAVSLPLPTGASTSANQTTANGYLATIASESLAQGSTTSGQLGQLEMGAVTTAAPTYTTATTSPLSLDTSGNLRVVVSGTASVTPVYDYATTASLASAATATHSVAGPLHIDSIEASASGEMKVFIAWGTTGSEVTYMVGFTSASDKTFQYQLPYPVTLTAGQSIKISMKNQDTSAMDVYSTVAYH